MTTLLTSGLVHPSGHPAPSGPPKRVPVLAMAARPLATMETGISVGLADPLLPRPARDFSISLGQASQWLASEWSLAADNLSVACTTTFSQRDARNQASVTVGFLVAGSGWP